MRKTLFLTGIVAAAFAGQALAQTSPAPAAADITRQQAMDRAGRLFDLLDVNHDGLLTRSEAERAGAQLRAQRAASGTDVAPGIGGHTARFLERRFAGARSIMREQFEQGMLAHFDRMDRDRDGVVTDDERQPAHATRPQGD
jgi:hypothetical protein